MDNKLLKDENRNRYDVLKEYKESQDDIRDAGRSLVYLLVGMALMGIGLFLIFQNTIVSVTPTLLDILGFTPPFGIIILPLLIGIGILFFNGKSIAGWIITIFGTVTILLAILMGLRMIFKPVTLYQAVLMFGMTAAGAGLFLKGLVGKRS